MGTTGGLEVTSPLLGDDMWDGNDSDVGVEPATLFKSDPGEVPDGTEEVLSACTTVFSLTGVDSLTGDAGISPTGLHVDLGLVWSHKSNMCVLVS